MTSLHRVAILLAASTLTLVLLGALVTSTGSGLSVTTWPATFSGSGVVSGPGALIQQAHRVMAALVGMLALVVAVMAWRVDRRPWMKGLVAGMLATGTAQAIYGGIGVLNLLPAFITVFHAALAQLFLAMTIAVAVCTSPAWLARTAARGGAPADRTLRRWAVAATATIYLQVIIGAAMRHSYAPDGRPAGFVIPDFPLAFGRLLPFSQLESWAVALGFLHRVAALAAAVVVAFTAARVFRRHVSEDDLVRPAALLMLLLVAQIALGGLTVLSGGHPVVATTHAAVVALALAAALVLALRASSPSAPMPAHASVRHNERGSAE